MISTKMLAPLLIIGVLVAGCSPVSEGPNPQEQGESDTSPAPEFSGPYKDAYLQVWTTTDSKFVHDVIADEQITEQEWAEVTSRLSDCLAENGIAFQGFAPDGSYTADASAAGDRADELATACESQSGSDWIGYLRQQQITNPENKDFNEIMAACLVREGAVADGYSADDYRDDAPDMSFPYLDPKEGPQIFAECNSDPLSLLSAE